MPGSRSGRTPCGLVRALVGVQHGAGLGRGVGGYRLGCQELSATNVRFIRWARVFSRTRPLGHTRLMLNDVGAEAGWVAF
jgi:hypothetical protein